MPPSRRRAVPLALALAGLLAAGCSSSDDQGPAAGDADPTTTTTAAATGSTGTTAGSAAAGTTGPAGAAPEVDDVYAVPDPLPPGEPGDVLQVQPLGEGYAGVAGSSAWRVLYHSRSIAEEDIAVSGVVVRPPGDAPEGGFPVVTWAHGTSGTADDCAPSKRDGPPVPFVADALAAGYVVVATDYEGLGTPGLHPYLLGESEGRGVLDAVRAGQRVDGVDAGSTVVVWGHSQGGHAALFAGEIAARYAPDLDVRGVVAIAPAGDLSLIGRAAMATPAVFPFAFMALGTWAEEYPELDLSAIFSPATLDLLPVLDQGCTDDVFAALAGRTAEELLATPDPVAVGPVSDLLADNSAGVRPLSGPILVPQGIADATVPAGLSEALVPRLCDAGADAELRLYEDADHSTVLAAARQEILAWTADRFAGAPPTPCA